MLSSEHVARVRGIKLRLVIKIMFRLCDDILGPMGSWCCWINCSKIYISHSVIIVHCEDIYGIELRNAAGHLALYILLLNGSGLPACSRPEWLYTLLLFWIGAARLQQALLALLFYGSGLPAYSRPYRLCYYTDRDCPPAVGHIGFVLRLGWRSPSGVCTHPQWA